MNLQVTCRFLQVLLSFWDFEFLNCDRFDMFTETC